MIPCQLLLILLHYVGIDYSIVTV